MLTNIVDCPPEQVKIGMPVEAVFDDVTPGDAREISPGEVRAPAE